MNAVMGLSYLLSQTALDADQRDFVDRIKLASKSLLGVINDILDLSKIEAGELSMETVPFSPKSELHVLARLMRGQAQDKGLRFDAPDLESLPPVLMGDPTRLNQILTNLLSNAIKFTQHGHVGLHTHVLTDDPQQVRIRFDVQDSGIGISPEAAATLFQPFAQADTSITRRFGGTGLGLSIVKQLVEMMGGCAGVDSEAGQGSRFWVEIPFTPGDPAALAALIADQPALGQTPLADVRVLVVDDSPVNLDVAKRILELEGATVDTVGDGAAAVAYLREHAARTDVVLMDVQMPVMDGLTATQTIRSTLQLHQLPIIALTAGAMTSERQQARDVGMNDFIGKPFDPRVVVDSICRLVPPSVRARHGNPQATEVPATPASNWPAIDGIAVETVSKRLGGDLKLYCSLLRNFMSEFASLALPEGQPEREALAATGRIMHKLRGSAGNVGAQRVFELAAQAEQACQQGQLAALAEHIASLNAEIRGLQQGVERFLAQQEAAVAASTLQQGVTALDPQEVRRLMNMLRQHDVGALDQFDLLSAGLQARLGSDTVAQIQAKLTQLAFLDAADMLTEQGFA
jgi:CheY-like chemotaxis protein